MKKGRFQLQKSHLSMDAPLAYGFTRCENPIVLHVKQIVAGNSKEAAPPVSDIFCTECATYDFWNNSDLSLTISKQIIGGNEGAISGINIRSTHAGAASQPLGQALLLVFQFRL